MAKCSLQYLQNANQDRGENFSGTVKVSGIQLTNLRFADGSDHISVTKAELVDPAKIRDASIRNHGMETSAEKRKTLVTSRAHTEEANCSTTNFKAAKLEEVKTCGFSFE